MIWDETCISNEVVLVVFVLLASVPGLSETRLINKGFSVLYSDICIIMRRMALLSLNTSRGDDIYIFILYRRVNEAI